jgi:hypothetical protein
LREFGMRLNRIPSFSVSFLRGADGENVAGADGFLVAFEPFRSGKRRNSAYLFKMYEEPNELLGRSVADVAWNIEAAGDKAFNDALRILELMADPPGTYSSTGLKNPTADTMQRFNEPGKRIAALPNVRPDDVLKLMEYRIDPAHTSLIQMAKQEFEQTTGVSAASQGMAVSRTATQDKLAQQGTDNRLNDIAISMFREMRRLMLDMQEDRYLMDGKEKYIERAVEVSGRSAEMFREYMESPDGIWKDIKIDSSITFGRDKMVMGAAMLNGKGLAQPGVFDEQEFWRTYFAVNGMPNVSFINDQFSAIDPEEEHDQLFGGTWVSPNVQEDVMGHMAAHQKELVEQQQVLAGMEANPLMLSPEDLEARRSYVASLQNHLAATQQIMPMAIQFQMEQAMAAQGMQGGGQAPPGKASGAPPDTDAAAPTGPQPPGAGADMGGIMAGAFA